MSLQIAGTSESAALHVDDGDLLRFEDGELDASERARVITHLEVCARCSDRHVALVAIAARLHAVTHNVEMPAALAVPPWSRSRVSVLPRTAGRAGWVTAALALLAVAAAAATPVRHWISDRAEASRVSAARSTVDGPRPKRTVDSSASHAASLSFVPTSALLSIGLDARSGDSIEVRPTEREAVRVSARSTGGEPTLIVKPDRLGLVSAGQGVTVYTVDVPPNVRMLDVSDRNRVLVHLTRAALEVSGAWRAVLP
jgi:anti-sigma factor RsiW